MTIKSDVRAKVIELANKGKGRNEIVHELSLSNIQISFGSVTNILRESKEGKNNSTVATADETETHSQTPQSESESRSQFLTDSQDPGSIASEADLRQALKIKSYLERLGLDVRDKEDSIENFMANLAMQSDPAKLIEVSAQVSKLPPDLDLEKLDEYLQYIKQRQAQLDKIKVQQTETEVLQKEIEEKRRILLQIDVEKKAAEGFKLEVKKYGLDTLDSKRFVDTLQVFQRFNFDYNKMVEMFVEVQDIVAEKRNINQLKEEVTHQTHVLNTRLEELGMGDFEQFTQTVAALITLESFGISQEQVIGLCRNLGQRRQQQQQDNRTRPRSWVNDNNGGSQYQEYGYNYY